MITSLTKTGGTGEEGFTELVVVDIDSFHQCGGCVHISSSSALLFHIFQVLLVMSTLISEFITWLLYCQYLRIYITAQYSESRQQERKIYPITDIFTNITVE